MCLPQALVARGNSPPNDQFDGWLMAIHWAKLLNSGRR